MKQGKQRVKGEKRVENFERPYTDVWAGLQTEHGMRSVAGKALQVFTACLERYIPCHAEAAWMHNVN